MRNVEICEKPVFIIGSPRSGTSIVALSLSQHSQFWTSAESFFLSNLFPENQLRRTYMASTTHKRVPSWLVKNSVNEAEFFNYIGIGINALFTSRSRGKRWIDQTPSYTLMVDVVADLFPEALFVNVLRDGRRVVNSMIHMNQAIPPDAQILARERHWSTDFLSACATWKKYVTRAIDFAAENPTRCITIRNEKMVTDAQNQFRRLLNFLDAPFEDAPVEFFQSHRINSSFPDTSSDAPPSIDGIWRAWTAEQQRLFLQEAGNTLVDSGLASDEEIANLDRELGVERGSDVFARRQEVSHIHRAIQDSVPPGFTVLVLGKGDSAMVSVDSVDARHFPASASGGYAGEYPANGDDAVRQVRSLAIAGAKYLAIPRSSFWWLNHYPEFAEYLHSSCSLASEHPDCLLYELDAE